MIKVTPLLTWFFFLGYIVNYLFPTNAYSENISFILKLLEIYFWAMLLVLMFFRLLIMHPKTKVEIKGKLKDKDQLFNPSLKTKILTYVRQSVTLLMVVFFGVVLGKFRLSFLFLFTLILGNSLFEKSKEVVLKNID